jgi:hypothetical protein
MAVFLASQLPVFDASKEGFRTQDSVVRILKKRRRQKQVVGIAPHGRKTEASESSSSIRHNVRPHSRMIALGGISRRTYNLPA